MANPAHVDILRQGVSVWNDWRRKNPDIVPDLKSMNFADVFASSTGSRKSSARKAQVRLQAINLKGAQLDRAVIDNVDLRNADLSDASLRFVSGQACDLRGADLRRADLTSANLASADLSAVDAAGALFIGTKFLAANLRKSKFQGADVSLADFSGAKVQGIDLGSVDLRRRLVGVTSLANLAALFTDEEQAGDPKSRYADEPTSSKAGSKAPPSRYEFKGEVKDLEVLKRGVEAWNKWRAENPGHKPNLEGLDFHHHLSPGSEEFKGFWGHDEFFDLEGERILLDEINFANTNLKGVNLREVRMIFCDLRNAKMEMANLSGSLLYSVAMSDCDLTSANIEEAQLVDCDARGATFHGVKGGKAKLSGQFFRADFSSAKLVELQAIGQSFEECKFAYADLTRADLFGAKLHKADFAAARLSEASLIRSHVQDTNFSFARVDGMNVAQIAFKDGESKMLLFVGIGGVTEVYGDLIFQKTLKDRAYIDTLKARMRSEYLGPQLPGWLNDWLNSGERRRWARRHLMLPTLRWMIALFGGFATLTPWLGATLGVLAWLVITQQNLLVHDNAQDFVNHMITRHSLLGFALGFFIAFGFLGGWIGRKVGFKIWQLFDYGNSWGRVLLFGLVMVLLFGFGYEVGSPTHVSIAATDASQQFLLYPWYVAAMGFATLGIADLVEPVTGLGMLLILGNVLSGWLTLGLLISVMGDSFKQR